MQQRQCKMGQEKKQNGKERRHEQKGIDNIATFRFD